MSKNQQTEARAREALKKLQDEELRLFRSYNRHLECDVKLGMLHELIQVISKISIIKKEIL